LPVLLQTEFADLQVYARGKVRDLYAVGEYLLLVATDRISAFDHVLGSGIPGKGKVLSQLSLFWFDLLIPIVPNHLITADVAAYPQEVQPFAEELDGRSMLVAKAQMFPVECVVRGYLSGFGLEGLSGDRSGLRRSNCRAALRESERLPEPLFTPASKSQDGEHDEIFPSLPWWERVGKSTAETTSRLESCDLQ